MGPPAQGLGEQRSNCGLRPHTTPSRPGTESSSHSRSWADGPSVAGPRHYQPHLLRRHTLGEAVLLLGHTLTKRLVSREAGPGIFITTSLVSLEDGSDLSVSVLGKVLTTEHTNCLRPGRSLEFGVKMQGGFCHLPTSARHTLRAVVYKPGTYVTVLMIRWSKLTHWRAWCSQLTEEVMVSPTPLHFPASLD